MSRYKTITEILKMVFAMNECHAHDEVDFDIHVGFNGYNEIQATLFEGSNLVSQWSEGRGDTTLEDVYQEVLNKYTEVADLCKKRKEINESYANATESIKNIADKFDLSASNWKSIFRNCLDEIEKVEKDGAENV